MNDSVPLNLPSEPKAVMVRFARVKENDLEGNRDHDLRFGPQPAYVDKDRAHLNRYLIAPPEPHHMVRRSKELHRKTGSQRAPYRNTAVAISGLIGFGLEAQKLFLALSPELQDDSILAVGRAIEKNTGCYLVGAVIHHDESAPHAHLTFESRHGQTGQPFTAVAHLPNLQTLTAETMQTFEPGFRRGTARKGVAGAGPVYRTVKRMHQDLPAEIHALEQRRDRLARETADAEQIQVGLEDAMRQVRELQQSLEARQQQIDEQANQQAQAQQTLIDRAGLLEERETALAGQAEELQQVGRQLTTFVQVFDRHIQRLVAQGLEPPERPALPEVVTNFMGKTG